MDDPYYEFGSVEEERVKSKARYTYIVPDDVLATIHLPGAFAEVIRAGGPWEARFIFCGRHGVRPDLVEVTQSMCCNEWFCRVGEVDPDWSPFVKLEAK
jgi:hypothetical protein